MLERFEGEGGRRLCIEALSNQRVLVWNQNLVEEIADKARLIALKKDEMLIEQDASDNDVYFILSGSFNIVINGCYVVAQRHAGETVGEMAAIEVTQKRSASVIANNEAIVAALSEPDLADLGKRYPELWRQFAKDIARRLKQRNAFIGHTNDRIRIFIISSVEALPIARLVQNALAHDPFITIVWTDGVFKVTNYTLQSLEDEIAQSDFAIAIAHSDDLTESRGQSWPAPRDNVIFELGLFMGKLGRSRAILMEPREEKLKLPSDLAGITTITYRFENGRDAEALIAPACNMLRNHVNNLGPKS